MNKSYWIKERFNPHIGTYYVGIGQLSKREARQYENSFYGSIVMHEFSNEKDYYKRLEELKESEKKSGGKKL